MTKTMTRKLLALLLALTMCFSLLPVPAFADGEPEAGACEHEPAEAVSENVVEPGCTAPGSHDEVVYCALCGEELEREEAEDPPLGHAPGEAVRENEVPPSCTEPGSHDEVVYCTRCGEELERESVADPAAHTPKDVEEVPPQVGVPGHRAGVVCAVCGETLEGCEELEALPEPEDEPEDEPERVRVEFVCEPAETQVTVYAAARDEEDTLVPALDEGGEPVVLEPEEDGAWLLLPGEYLYDAAYEGYVGVEKAALAVAAGEDGSAQTVALTLEAQRRRGMLQPLGSGETSGSCGKTENDNVTWSLDDGVLTISGAGAMADYTDSNGNNAPPWYSHKSDIESLVIESGVTAIGKWAFANLDTLTDASIAGTVTNIADCAFGSTGLTSVTLPEGVTSIGMAAFAICSSLASVTLPKSLTSIGAMAFFNSGLNTVFYGGTEAEWGSFTGSSGFGTNNEALTGANIVCSDSPEYDPSSCGTNVHWTLDDAGVLTISGTGACTLTPWKPTYTGAVKSVVLESGVTAIPDSAFKGCRNLESVSIAGSVTGISQKAFYNCTSLTSVTIPEGMQTIGKDAFQNCSALTSITIPGSVTSIGQGAFAFSGLTSVTIPEGMQSISKDAFKSCAALASVTIQEGVTSIGIGAFTQCSSLASVTLPKSMTSIDAYTFDGTALSMVYYGGTEAEWASLKRDGIGVGNAALTGANVICSDSADGGSCGRTEDDNLRWTMSEGGTLRVYGTGAMADYTASDGSAPPPWSDYKGEIKSVVLEFGVTAIGSYAFSGCTGLTSAVFPRSLQLIDENAFSGCTGLAEGTVSYPGTEAQWTDFLESSVRAGNEVLASAAFATVFEHAGYCGASNVNGGQDVCWGLSAGVLYIYGTGPMGLFFENPSAPWKDYRGSIISVEIAEGVTTIGGGAFFGCESLTGVTIPWSVTEIQGGAFYNCRSLTSVEIPAGVIKIGYDAFDNCTALTEISIPVSVTKIDDSAFYLCQNLTDVYYGGTSAQWNAVSGKDQIPGGATVHFALEIGGSCGKTANDKVYWGLDSNGVLTISGTGEMDYYSASGMPWNDYKADILSVVVKAGVTGIGKHAFYGCGNLTNVTLPTGLKSIAYGAFSNCTSLEFIDIPTGVTSIGDSAFASCESLTGITLPASVTSIGDAVFMGCENLESVSILGNVTEINYRTFSGCKKLTAVTLPASVTSIGESAFAGCESLTGITLPASVTSIGEAAFAGCESLTGITIPKGVTSIGYEAFGDCGKLEAISVEDGNSSFAAQDGVLFDKAMTTLLRYPAAKADSAYTVPENVTDIYDCAFDSCKNLNILTLPANVTGIGEYAFSGCTGLREVYFLGTKSEWDLLTSPSYNGGGNGGGNACLTGAAVYCIFASGSCGTEGNNLTWKLYDIIGTDGCRLLVISGTGAMEEFDSGAVPWILKRLDFDLKIISAVIEEGVTNIGSYAFEDCNELERVAIPASVNAIGEYVFYGCSALTEIDVDADNWSFCVRDDVLFDRAMTRLIVCPAAKTGAYAIPAGVTRIDSFALFRCAGLTEVTLPAGVTSIGDGAFYGCENLTGVTIRDGLEALGMQLFNGCVNLTAVTLPASVTSIGAAAFDHCGRLTDVYYGGTAEMWGKIDIAALNDVLASDDVTIHCIVDSGSAVGVDGQTVRWTLDSTGLLTISGTGPMDFGEGNVPWGGYRDEICTVVIEAGVTSICANAFDGCGNLADVTIPAGVTSIGSRAFCGCTGLTEITLPRSLEHVGKDAFNGCTGLTKVSYTGTQAQWAALTGDPDRFEEGNDALLVQGLVESTVVASGKCGAEGDNVCWTLDKSGLLTIYGSGAMEDYFLDVVQPDWLRYDIFSVVIEEGVTNVGEDAFNMCEDLKSVTLPAGLTSIGKGAFDSCYSLTSVTIPAGVTSIGARAFIWSGLTDVTLPESLTALAYGTFGNCSALKSVTIPASVTSIDENCFSECSALKDVYFGGTSQQWNELVNGNAIGEGNDALLGARIHILVKAFGVFGNCSWKLSDTGVLTISGTGAMKDYNYNTMPWYDWRDEIRVVIVEKGVTSIGSFAFDGCRFMTDITLPAGLTSIGRDAFEECTALKDVYFGGTRTQWTALLENNCGENNEALTAATVHYGRFTVDCSAAAATVTADKADAAVGEIVTLTVIPAVGFTLGRDGLRVSYTDALGAPQNVALTQGEVCVWTFVMPAYDVTVTADLEAQSVPETIKLNSSYLMLEAGDTAQLTVTNLPVEWTVNLQWTSDNEAVAAVDAKGKVTSVAKGTAWITASVDTGTGVLFGRCRIDVTEKTISEELVGVRLVDTKATVQLYKTDYTRITLLPELKQNISFAQAAGADSAPVSSAGDRGMAIESAYFADALTSTHFALRVVDDRTLEIVPREAFVTTNAAALKQLQSKYKSAIIVTVEGTEYTTGTLTLELKRKLPSVTAKMVKLSSFLIGDEQPISFSSKVDAARVSSKPGWLSFDENTLSVTYTGQSDVGRTDKLKLLVKPAGWAVEQTVSVKVKVSKSAPKLSLKPASVTLRLNVDELVTTAAKITPASFADPDAWPITVVSVKEGKKNAGAALDVITDGHSIRVRPGANAPTDGKAHSYKVTLAIARGGQASPVCTTLTVKLPAARTKIRLSATASGYIDTLLPESPITLKVKATGIGTPLLTADDVTVLKEKRKTSEDVTELFEIRQSGSMSFVLTEKTAGSLQSGCSYTAVIAKNYGQQTATCRVKLPVRFSTKLKKSVTLSVSGSVDVIRPGNAVTVKPTVKNCFTYKPDAADLHIWKKDGKNWTDVTASSPFNVAVKDGRFALTLKDNAGVDPRKDSFQVSLTATLDGVSVSSGKAALKLKMGYARITQSANEVQLLKTDRNSRATVKLGTRDPAVSIDWARTEAAFASPKYQSKNKFFELEYLGGGEYAIGYRNSEITTNTTTSVKIPVYLVGSSDTKPNETVTVKVRFK